MRDLAKRYLQRTISRRDFVRLSTAAGFSLAATQSAVHALEPVMSAPSKSAGEMTTTFQGTGGELMAEQLRAAGVKFIFVCNSSGQGPLCDAVADRPDLQFIQATSEHQAVAIADGYAKATLRPSFAAFSRVGGPLAGANMFNSMKDRTPLVVVTDHIDTGADGRDGAEDTDDWLEAFKQYTKWRWVTKEGNRIPEWLAHAFKIASTPPCGPAFLRVPRNVLYQKHKAEIFSNESISVPMNLVPNPRLVEAAARMLVEAKNPIMFVGAEVTATGGRADVVELAELLSIPVTQGWSWSADFPTDHPLYLAGYHPPLRDPADIDLFLNLGAKMPDQGSGAPLVPREARIIHGRIESSQIGINYPTDVAVVGDVRETARALVQAVKSIVPADRLAAIRKRRFDETKQATDAYRAAYIASAREDWNAAPVTWPRLLLTLEEMLDHNAVVVEEVGTEDWVLHSFAFGDGKKMKIGRTLGRALGWGLGASIGVKLAVPDRQVVALLGDGGFLFGQSDALWSMSRYDVPVIAVIGNNRSYDEPRNNIWMHGGRSQQQSKDMICYLGSPDVEYSDIARAFGIKGERINAPDELRPAIQRAIATTRDGRPYLLDVRVARTGLGADSTWYPQFSVASMRTRKV
jgi:thiamine pyrophosphate-dependent acetolactate synthase large subunit-like protein